MNGVFNIGFAIAGTNGGSKKFALVSVISVCLSFFLGGFLQDGLFDDIVSKIPFSCRLLFFRESAYKVACFRAPLELASECCAYGFWAHSSLELCAYPQVDVLPLLVRHLALLSIVHFCRWYIAPSKYSPRDLSCSDLFALLCRYLGFRGVSSENFR